MRLKTTLRALSDLDVRFVSLVDRGANRIPFRVIKSQQENAMIDLTNLGRVFKSEKKTEPQAPAKVQVQAVIIDNADPELVGKVCEVLKAEGLVFEKNKGYEDGTVALFTDENFSEGAEVISVGDHMAVVVKGFDTYKPGLTFMEMAKSRGFYDNIRNGMDALRDVVSTSLYKSEDQQGAKAEITKSLQEFNQYVLTLVDALPAVVFKVERSVDSLIADFKVPETVAAALEGEKPADGATEGASEGTVAVEKSADMDADEKKGKGKKVPMSKEEELLTSVQALTTTVEALVASVKKANDGVDALSTSLEAVQSAQKATEEKVADAIQKADTANRAVNQTVVVGGEGAGDPIARTEQVRKSDDDPRTGLFDSAFLNRKR